MKKTLFLLLLAALAAACSRRSEGGGARLRTDVDSVAYVIGMNAVSYTHLTLPTILG